MGVAAITWVLVQCLAYVLDAVGKLVSSLALWTRAFFIPHSIQTAIGVGVAFLIYTAFIGSREQ